MHFWKDDPDATLGLAKCPPLREFLLRKSVPDLNELTDVVAPFLLEPKRKTAMLDHLMWKCFEDIEVAAIEAVKILRLREDPAARVVLLFEISIQQRNEDKDVQDKVVTIIEIEGERMVLTLVGHNYFLENKITLGLQQLIERGVLVVAFGFVRRSDGQYTDTLNMTS